MPKRILKQFSYGVLFLLFWAAVGYGAWNTWYQPTCFDRIKNQGEEAVDCGGPCVSCGTRVLGQPLILRTVWISEASSGKMDLAAEVKNPNASWGARELSYSFTVLDQAARTLGSVDGKGFLMPGETRWFVAPAVSVSGRIADVRFTISKESVGWQKFKSFSQDVSLATRNVWFRKIVPPEIGFAELSGEVENRSSFTLDSVEVSGTIFDSKSAVIALGKTLLKTVKPSEVRHFSIKWQSHFEGDAARWEAQAKSNFLLDQNFILKYGE